MKTNYLVPILIVFILCGCKKEDKLTVNLSKANLSEISPTIPEAVNYDLNNDSADDIKIQYGRFSWDGFGICGSGIYGSITPLDKNSILLKQDEYTLFNKLNDIIKVNSTEPYHWEKWYGPAVVSIQNSSADNFFWPNEWKIKSKTLSDFYYMGVKINNNGRNLIGWIKIKIDKSTGKIQLLNKKLTTKEFIVIGK